jgi:predicted MFS family arabinose efflux permease
MASAEAPDFRQNWRQLVTRPPQDKKHRNARYAFIVLCGVALFNYIDRQILVILLDSVKHDFGVSDAAMGLLTGTTFSVFYVLGSMPLARWADGGVRRNVLAWALGVWSAMTAVCGMAQSYLQLAVARASVAASESAAMPISHSMLSDLYPPAKRATVFGILMAAGAAGIAAGLYLGGWINQHYGWRMTFFVVGLPGIVLALLLRFTVTEPARHAGDESRSSALQLMKEPLFAALMILAALGGIAVYATLTWSPAFLLRVHHLKTAEIGWKLGLATGLGTALGHLATGYIADKLAERSVWWYARVASVGSLLAIPFGLAFLFLQNVFWCVLSLFALTFLLCAWYTPTYALALRMATSHTRARASALITASMVLIGLGLGPLAVGCLNDLLAPTYAEQAVRYSMLAILCVIGIMVIGYWCFAVVGSRNLDKRSQADDSRVGAAAN